MRNPIVEQWLTQNEVDWKYVPTVPLARFNIKKSLTNQARLDPTPLNDDRVVEYALAVEDGYELPAVVAWRDNEDNYVLCDGNNRLAAYTREGLLTKPPVSIDAYVLESSDPRVIDMVTRSINTTNGMRPTREQMVAQAVSMVERDGLTAREAAKKAGVPAGAVERARRVKAIRSTAAGLDIEPRAFKDTTLLELGKVKNKSVLGAALNFTRDASLGVEATKTLVSDIMEKEPDGEQAMLNVVQKYRNNPVYKSRMTLTRRGAAPRAMRGGDKRTKFLLMLTAVESMLDGAKSLADFGITTNGERVDVNKRWLEIRSKMQGVLRG